MPKVSVCIPTYNTARYLLEAIESVLAQEFDDYELVICDNASTDETPEICRSYTDPRIRYCRFEELVNQAGNFNRCLKEACGEFITLLHSDDLLLPGFLADRVSRLERNPGPGFVFGAVEIIDEKGERISISKRWAEDRRLDSEELVGSLLMACIVSPPSLMVKKSVADKAGPFRTDLTWGHDWEWTIRLAGIAAAEYSAAPMAAYRVHGASGTADILAAARNGHQERRILRETFARIGGDEKRLGHLRREAFVALGRRHMYFAEQALFEGQRAVVRNNLRYAAMADPRLMTRPTYWALLAGSIGSIKWYARYRAMRNNAAEQKVDYERA